MAASILLQSQVSSRKRSDPAEIASKINKVSSVVKLKNLGKTIVDKLSMQTVHCFRAQKILARLKTKCYPLYLVQLSFRTTFASGKSALKLLVLVIFLTPWQPFVHTSSCNRSFCNSSVIPHNCSATTFS